MHAWYTKRVRDCKSRNKSRGRQRTAKQDQFAMQHGCGGGTASLPVCTDGANAVTSADKPTSDQTTTNGCHLTHCWVCVRQAPPQEHVSESTTHIVQQLSHHNRIHMSFYVVTSSISTSCFQPIEELYGGSDLANSRMPTQPLTH